MDFFAMKRKKLQDLCKNHGIPANKTNKEMAQKLSLIYKRKEEDPITIEDTDDEKEKGIGKFLAMKRKKLQDLCKKHGIPANWKSKKMAEKLSLIYKEKEDTDDTNSNVQMEASDNASGKESNADGKAGDEAGEQDHNNSSDKTGLVEEVNTLNENITEASTMCHDTSIGANDTDGKTNVTAEDILDEVVSHKMVALAPGTDTKSADTCVVEETMSMRPASEKMIDSSPKLISNSETTIDDLGVCDVDENMQIGSNTEQVDHIQEVLLEGPSMVVMKDDEDLQQVTSQDLQVADMEICDMEVNVQHGVNKGQVDHSQEVFHTKPSEDIQVHDMGFSDSEVNMQIGVNEEQGDHCQEVVVVMKDKDDLVQVVSEDTQVDDMGFSDEEENTQIGVNEEIVNYSQEVLHAKADFPDKAPGKKIAEYFLRNHQMVSSEKNLQEGVNQEKVDDDNQEQHLTAPCSDAHVVSGEFCDYLVDGEVERLSQRTFVFEDANEAGKVGDEDHNNSPDVTLLHTSLKESSGLTGLAEQVNNLDENITKASTMCLDKSIGAKDIDGKTNVIVEDILNEVNSDGTQVQFHLTDPLGEETPILNDAHKIVAPVTCEAKFVSSSSQKISMSPASEKMIESSPKLTSDSETTINDMGLGDVEENLHIVVNKDKVDHCQEVLHEEPSMVTSQDPQVADMGLYDMEENIQLGDYKGQVDYCQEVFHTKPSVVSMNEDLVHVFSEDMQVGVNKEQADHCQKVLHEESSMVFMKDDDDLQQVTSKDLQFSDMRVCDMEENMQLGVNKGQVDHSREVFHISSSVVFMNEDLVQVVSEHTQVDDMGFSDMEENLQIGIMQEMDALDNAHGKESDADGKKIAEHFLKNHKMVASEENLQEGVNQEKVDDDNQEQHPITPSSYAHVISREFDNYLMEGEVEKLSERTSVFEDTSETGKVGDEAETEDHKNSPDVSLLHTSLKESSVVSALVEEVSNLDENITEASTMCFDTDGKTNVTVEEVNNLHEDSSVVVMKVNGDLQQVTSQDLQVADMEIRDVEENMQLGVNKEEVDHTQEVFHIKPSVDIMNEDLVQVVSKDMQVGVNKDNIDHSQEVLHAEPRGVVMRDDDHLLSVASQDLQVADMELCDMDETMQLGVNKGKFDDIQVDNSGFSDDMLIGVNEDQGDHSQEVLHAESSAVVMKDKDDLVQVASEDIKVSDMGFSDVEENILICVNLNEDHVSYSQENLNAEPRVVVMKDDEDCVKVALEDTQVNEEQVNYRQEILHAEPNVVLMKDNEDSVQVALEDIQFNDMGLCAVVDNMHQMDMDALDADTCKEMFKSSQKTGQIADQEDCIGYFPNNNLEASVSKDFEAETYFDPSTLGDVEGTMNEIMQSGKMEKENSQEECSFNRLFENSDIHDDTSGMGAEAENQSNMMSHKRKRSDVDDTNGLDSAVKEKADEFVPTMTQLGGMESCDFNLNQLFASGTTYGDEGTCYQEKLESPAKGTPIESSKKNINFSPKFHGSSMMNKGLENESSLPLTSASDMKENIKIDKKDQVGSMMSKSKFAKRQPLQDLQQN